MVNGPSDVAWDQNLTFAHWRNPRRRVQLPTTLPTVKPCSCRFAWGLVVALGILLLIRGVK